jgi:hypothetical protein
MHARAHRGGGGARSGAPPAPDDAAPAAPSFIIVVFTAPPDPNRNLSVAYAAGAAAAGAPQPCASNSVSGVSASCASTMSIRTRKKHARTALSVCLRQQQHQHLPPLPGRPPTRTRSCAASTRVRPGWQLPWGGTRRVAWRARARARAPSAKNARTCIKSSSCARRQLQSRRAQALTLTLACPWGCLPLETTHTKESTCQSGSCHAPRAGRDGACVGARCFETKTGWCGDLHGPCIILCCCGWRQRRGLDCGGREPR